MIRALLLFAYTYKHINSFTILRISTTWNCKMHQNEPCMLALNSSAVLCWSGNLAAWRHFIIISNIACTFYAEMVTIQLKQVCFEMCTEMCNMLIVYFNQTLQRQICNTNRNVLVQFFIIWLNFCINRDWTACNGPSSLLYYIQWKT